VIVTVGTALTFTVMVVVPTLPPASVMAAVMMWMPPLRPTVTLAPTPKSPSRLDDQRIVSSGRRSPRRSRRR
jgi:hypothetical protein